MQTGTPTDAGLGWIVPLLVILVLVAAAVLAVFGWERYRGRTSTRVQPTPEVFIDPATGMPMRVWYDPTTGVREYRPEPPPPGAVPPGTPRP